MNLHNKFQLYGSGLEGLEIPAYFQYFWALVLRTGVEVAWTLGVQSQVSSHCFQGVPINLHRMLTYTPF